MQKFVETSGSKEVGKVNEFYAKCQKEQTPYILVEKSRVYATVRWDYISYTHKTEELISKNQENYIDDFKSLFDKYKNNKSKYHIGHGLVEFYEIENEKSQDMASELYDIVLKVVAPQ